MDSLAEDQLKQIMPKSGDLSIWTRTLNDAMRRFEIDNIERTAAFLAQIAHESSELSRLVENLNFSAKRLLLVWPKRFPTLEKASLYERNPEKLAKKCVCQAVGQRR